MSSRGGRSKAAVRRTFVPEGTFACVEYHAFGVLKDRLPYYLLGATSLEELCRLSGGKNDIFPQVTSESSCGTGKR